MRPFGQDFVERSDPVLSVLWVVVAAFLIGLGRRTIVPLQFGGTVGALLQAALFVAAVGIIILAVSDVVSTERMSRPAAVCVAVLLAALGCYNFVVMPATFFASDVSLFESWASHLLLAGQNPMAADMTSAKTAWNVSADSANITALEGGGVVSSYSYPGGTLWISTVEAALSPMHRLGLSTVLVSTAFLVWLIYRVNDLLIPLAVLVWIIPLGRTLSAGMGMITPLWLFPLAVGLAAWYDGRLMVAAVGLGIAAAGKQLAWPVVGLVLVHVLRTREWQLAARVSGVAAGVALLLTAPFWLSDPSAWLHSMFFSLGSSDVVRQGVGLTTLSLSGIYVVPKTVHSLLTVGVGLSFIAATWRWPDQMQWLIPFGAICTMVVHYRTLPSYYASVVPLAVVALDARLRAGGANYS